jgi:hypothetical protein
MGEFTLSQVDSSKMHYPYYETSDLHSCRITPNFSILLTTWPIAHRKRLCRSYWTKENRFQKEEVAGISLPLNSLNGWGAVIDRGSENGDVCQFGTGFAVQT